MTRKNLFQFFILAGLSLFLVGCMDSTFAPVDEGWQKPRDVGGVYQAKQGETLQDIAWRFNLSVPFLAKLNGLTPPYTLKKGQIVYLTLEAKAQHRQPSEQTNSDENRTNSSSSLSNNNENETISTSESHLTVEPVSSVDTPKVESAGGVTSMAGAAAEKSNSSIADAQKVPTPTKKGNWQWPIQGQVVGNFSENGSKGMEIKGSTGESVAASRGGQIVYAGNGLPGYGNLVIIKHPDGLMSVYAQNRKLLVKEGDHVQAGQSIAEVGDSSKLHFEIRKDGKPVDPSPYLGN